ncbi:DUF1566 domain-containing protein [Teredinibacter waterburyi]|jgi:Protein of unknown function (DUF1566).|uniref:Lcl C-terminal domain-containing protein n=1 Tax=Teredinibacter waterburyi TaxID=1500538 RepID=UPI00165F1AAF|nr:DUF1566 domain-containing protein [Teredinibacter waterburyi]
MSTKSNSLVLLLLSLLSGFALAEQNCQTDTIAASTPLERFKQSEDGTVVDADTGLMWRECLEGVTGASCDEGEPVALTWAGALTYVPTLNANGGFAGYSDWRLPNIRELSTLVELQCSNPAMNVVVFENAPSTHVWASSPYHFYTHYSWYVDFSNGAATYDERIVSKTLRLVRDIK